MIKIGIQREWCFGTCGCDSIYFWENIKVTPQELVELINHCETIKLLFDETN